MMNRMKVPLPQVVYRPFPDLHFLVRAEVHNDKVRFDIYRPDDTEVTATMTPTQIGNCLTEGTYLDMEINNEGCSNFGIADGNVNWRHCCVRKQLLEIGEIMAKCWDLAAELCPTWDKTLSPDDD